MDKIYLKPSREMSYSKIPVRNAHDVIESDEFLRKKSHDSRMKKLPFQNMKNDIVISSVAAILSDNSDINNKSIIVNHNDDISTSVQGPDSVDVNKTIKDNKNFPKNNLNNGNRSIRTLWVGDLDKAEAVMNAGHSSNNGKSLNYKCVIDEAFLIYTMFYEFSSCINKAKVCRNNTTRSVSFGFVEFFRRKQAEYCLYYLNNRWVPGKQLKFKLNWATFNISDNIYIQNIPKPSNINIDSKASNMNNNAENNIMNVGNSINNKNSSISLWIGNLSTHMTKEYLEQFLCTYFKGISLVKVVLDQETGLCKGYGFVHFNDVKDAENVLYELNGYSDENLTSGRPIKINWSSNMSSNVKTETSSIRTDGLLTSDRSSHCNGIDIMSNQSNLMCSTYDENLTYKNKRKYDNISSSITTNGNDYQNYKKHPLNVSTINGSDNIYSDISSKLIIVSDLDVAFCSENYLHGCFSYFGVIDSIKIDMQRNEAQILYDNEISARNAQIYMHGVCIGNNAISINFHSSYLKNYPMSTNIYDYPETSYNYFKYENSSNKSYSGRTDVNVLKYPGSITSDESTLLQNTCNVSGNYDGLVNPDFIQNDKYQYNNSASLNLMNNAHYVSNCGVDQNVGCEMTKNNQTYDSHLSLIKSELNRYFDDFDGAICPSDLSSYNYSDPGTINEDSLNDIHDKGHRIFVFDKDLDTLLVDYRKNYLYDDYNQGDNSLRKGDEINLTKNVNGDITSSLKQDNHQISDTTNSSSDWVYNTVKTFQQPLMAVFGVA